MLITAVLGGISYMLYGVVTSLVGFTVVTALANFFGMGYCWTCANALMASWFPTKKGLALGWATMGQNLCSATFVILLSLVYELDQLERLLLHHGRPAGGGLRSSPLS